MEIVQITPSKTSLEEVDEILLSITEALLSIAQKFLDDEKPDQALQAVNKATTQVICAIKDEEKSNAASKSIAQILLPISLFLGENGS